MIEDGTRFVSRYPQRLDGRFVSVVPFGHAPTYLPHRIYETARGRRTRPGHKTPSRSHFLAPDVSPDMAEGDTLANALIGGAVAIFLSFLPLSPVLGGAVAGYLQGGDRGDGARVGAIAGAVAFLPIVGIGVLVLGVGTFYVGSGSPFALGVGGLLLLLLMGLVVAGLYTVGLGALGGWLGNYVRYDTDLGSPD